MENSSKPAVAEVQTFTTESLKARLSELRRYL
jgi:hypothetical protein